MVKISLLVIIYTYSKLKKNKAKIIDKIYIGDRIRDIHYDKINDRLIMTLENEESILIVSTTEN